MFKFRLLINFLNKPPKSRTLGKKLFYEERPVFRNFEIANIKIKKDEFFDKFNLNFFFIFEKSFEHQKYLIIFDIVKY